MITRLFKIELNEQGDYIAIPTGNPTFYKKYYELREQVNDLKRNALLRCNRLKKGHGMTKEEKCIEMARVNVSFSKEAIRLLDGFFGDGTIKKYFRELYEQIPDFLPSEECFIDFFGKITPVIEKLYGSMSGYQ